jgi:hypothetical protein
MIKVTFDTINAAFDEENFEFEAARILRDVADKIENQNFNGKYQNIFDSNGNIIGKFKVKKD